MTVQANPALARKLSAGQDSVAEPPRSILRALRLGLARAAGDGLGLGLSVIGAKHAKRAQPELAERLQDSWLLLLFLSEQAGATAVCLDPGCVSAIVQQQTIGMVTSDPPSERVFTETDAAMTAPLFEDMLDRARGLVDGPADLISLSGYEYASRSEDVQALLLAMTYDRYRVVELTVELAGGARQGEICILLPDPPQSEKEQAEQENTPGLRLQQASGVMRAELNAVLCRMSLPLTSLSELDVGDVLPLSVAKLDKVQITTIERGRMAIGRLGQCGGMRAVRINEHRASTALTYSEPQPFLPSQPRTDNAGGQDITTASESGLTEGFSNLTSIGVDDDAGELLLTDSKQMISEISQLAGLPRSDETS